MFLDRMSIDTHVCRFLFYRLLRPLDYCRASYLGSIPAFHTPQDSPMNRLYPIFTLAATLGIAACTDQPVAPLQHKSVTGLRLSTQVGPLEPLTLATPRFLEPLNARVMAAAQDFASYDAAASVAAAGPLPIKYWGGETILKQAVVAIYYSATTLYPNGPTPGTSGSGPEDGSLVGYFLNRVGTSSYWNVNSTYYDMNGSSRHFVQPTMEYKGFWAPASGPSAGARVSDTAMVNLIEAGFDNHTLSYDKNTLYAIFTGPDVNLGGGFSYDNLQYCAFHAAYYRRNGQIVQVAAIPYTYDFRPSRLSATGFLCTLQDVAANDDVGADNVVSGLTHEIEETATDPYIDGFRGWYDEAGYENGDKCAYTYGGAAYNGHGFANLFIGDKPFLVQRNWSNATQSCLKSFVTEGKQRKAIGGGAL